MKDNLFCNNCGKTGHIYQKCRKPIISLGIIAVRYNPHIEYLLIRRRNTLGYVDFIRGKYTLASNDYIQQLFNIMTTDEIESLKTKSFDYFLLGMGADGHVASIFPSSSEINEKFIAKQVLRKDFLRISLSLNIINNSKKIILWLNNNLKSKNVNVPY